MNYMGAALGQLSTLAIDEDENGYDNSQKQWEL